MGDEALSCGKVVLGVALSTYPNLSQSLKGGRAIFLSRLAFMECYRVNFTYTCLYSARQFEVTKSQ